MGAEARIERAFRATEARELPLLHSAFFYKKYRVLKMSKMR